MSSLIPVLLQPAVPSALLVIWTIIWWNRRRTPPVLPAMDRRKARPGDVSRGGSTAAGKGEQRIRHFIERAGFPTYPQGTLLCVGKDASGKNRFFTPDILVRKPYLVVEVDPAYTHSGPEKIAEDIMRNRFYAAIGLKVVRIRIAGTEALSPNDVVIPQNDFRPERDGQALIAALGSAKRLSPHYWAQPELVRRRRVKSAN